MQSTKTNTTCRRCGAEIPENRIAHCRRLDVEPAGCSTRCSRALAMRAHRERERARDSGVSWETDRAIVAAIAAKIETQAIGAREEFFESSRTYKKKGAMRGRITALAV